MYSLKTKSIEVSVIPEYLADKSKPFSAFYVFAYKITVTNFSTNAVQLISRYWKINDSTNGSKTVKGEGVVGLQPIIECLDTFDYTSFSTLDSTLGTMEGYYTFLDLETKELFKVWIPKFKLEVPFILN